MFCVLEYNIKSAVANSGNQIMKQTIILQNYKLQDKNIILSTIYSGKKLRKKKFTFAVSFPNF